MTRAALTALSTLTGVAALLTALAALWRWRRRWTTVTIHGQSMEPHLHDGDVVLVSASPHRGRTLATGQVVVVAPPHEPAPPPARSHPRRRTGHPRWLVKRVAALPGEPVPPGLEPALAPLAGTPVPPGHMILLGDNPAGSYDSRQRGFVPLTQLRGVVIKHLPHRSTRHDH